MVTKRIRQAASAFVILAALVGTSGCSGMSSPSLGNRANFTPPDDPCWPAVESCHDSYPICPALCR